MWAIVERHRDVVLVPCALLLLSAVLAMVALSINRTMLVARASSDGESVLGAAGGDIPEHRVAIVDRMYNGQMQAEYLHSLQLLDAEVRLGGRV